jgi:hypothetical protein
VNFWYWGYGRFTLVLRHWSQTWCWWSSSYSSKICCWCINSFNMTHCTYTPTPLSTTYPLPLTDGSPLGSEDSRNIKALLATFNTSHWHALSCFSVNKVWYLHAPSTTQWKTTKRILHYVKSILNTRITFWKSLSTLLSTFYDRLSGGGFSPFYLPNFIYFYTKQAIVFSL